MPLPSLVLPSPVSSLPFSFAYFIEPTPDLSSILHQPLNRVFQPWRNQAITKVKLFAALGTPIPGFALPTNPRYVFPDTVLTELAQAIHEAPVRVTASEAILTRRSHPFSQVLRTLPHWRDSEERGAQTKARSE